MRLFTYFWAMEIARGRAGWSSDGKSIKKYHHLRDGLIARMERIEMKVKLLEAEQQLMNEWFEGLE